LHTSAVDAFGSPVAGPLGFVQDALCVFARVPRAFAQPLPVPASWPVVEIVAIMRSRAG
jgi:L-asparaginase